MDDLIKTAQAQYRQQHIDENWRQVILVRRDLNMSPGKLAAQVAHGSMAFIANYICNNFYDCRWIVAPNSKHDGFEVVETPYIGYSTQKFTPVIDEGLMQGWFEGSFTKIVLGVKDKQELDEILTKAWKEYGFEENQDYFCIRDNCLTELEPEEIGEDGIGRTLTVVGFSPMPKEIIDKVTGRLHLL